MAKFIKSGKVGDRIPENRRPRVPSQG
ncbi:unnamed protein product [Debaryomyces tyrocola]|nr:unnamed protein product [Debaryomyces tyrocola]